MSGLSLTYAINTNPAVLQAGGKGSFSIIVSATTAPVNLSKLKFVFKNGDAARDLIDNTDITPVLPARWTHTPMSGGAIIMTPPNNSPVLVKQEGLSFQFNDVQINAQIGSAIIQITEFADQTSTGQMLVPKFPESFVLNEFYSSDPIISQGHGLTLYWQGENLNLANYTLQYYDNGTIKKIAIPAAEVSKDPNLKVSNSTLYSYSLPGLKNTTNFYLQVIPTGSDSSNSFVRKSNEYPVTVTPAIHYFGVSTTDVNAGSQITLSWSVSSFIKNGQISCPQDGSVISLDSSALMKKQYQVTVPSIAITSEYILEVWDKDSNVSDTPTAINSVTIEVNESIPCPITPDKCGYFFTSVQAADIATQKSRTINDKVIPKLVQEIFKTFKVYYPDIDFYLDWSNEVVNAQSFVFYGAKKTVVLSGGLARCESLYYEGLCFIIAQSIARLQAKKPVDSNNLTYVGVADFYAT
jgi:hypothetical protein